METAAERSSVSARPSGYRSAMAASICRAVPTTSRPSLSSGLRFGSVRWHELSLYHHGGATGCGDEDVRLQSRMSDDLLGVLVQDCVAWQHPAQSSAEGVVRAGLCPVGCGCHGCSWLRRRSELGLTIQDTPPPLNSRFRRPLRNRHTGEGRYPDGCG